MLAPRVWSRQVSEGEAGVVYVVSQGYTVRFLPKRQQLDTPLIARTGKMASWAEVLAVKHDGSSRFL